MSCAPAGTAAKLPEGWDGSKDQHPTQDLQQNLPWLGSSSQTGNKALPFILLSSGVGWWLRRQQEKCFISQGKSAASNSLYSFSIIALNQGQGHLVREEL